MEPANLRNFDVWNLRGKAVPMDKLAPRLIRRAAKRDYIAIVIDPIYKVITGDENSADQILITAKRIQEGIFDCSSLVARAYCAQGRRWKYGGSVPTSNKEIYDDDFELLWPATYAQIGKNFGGASVINMASSGRSRNGGTCFWIEFIRSQGVRTSRNGVLSYNK